MKKFLIELCRWDVMYFWLFIMLIVMTFFSFFYPLVNQMKLWGLMFVGIFFAWLLYSNLLDLIRRYNSTYEGQITDKGMEELPGTGESAGGWKFWIKLKNDKNVFTKKVVSEDLYIQLSLQDDVKKVSGCFNTLANQKLVNIYMHDDR